MGVVTQGQFGGISYVLYNVSTPVAALVAGGSGLVGTYNDLGSGTELSDVISIAPQDQGTVKPIALLPAGVAAMEAARGGLFALGGGPMGLGGNVAFSGTDVSGAQLAIELAMRLDVDHTQLSWTDAPLADSYDVVRGDVGLLRSTAGDFTAATEECQANNHSSTSLPYTESPGRGDAFWFLVRDVGPVGNGTYDSGGIEQVGLRDAEIDLAPGSCP